MDKPRWFITWYIAFMAADFTYNDSFWWSVLKALPFVLAALLLEEYRSRRQNER